MTNKFYKVIIAAIVVLYIVTGGTLLFAIPKIVASYKPTVIEKPILIVNENDLIAKMIYEGNESTVYDFYDKITGNRKITYLIISHALSYNIPVHYFMALAYTESRFTPSAIGTNANSEGVAVSYDYGLFQLNSRTYNKFTREHLMTLENNVRMAAEHLNNDYMRYGSWYEALLSYNAGNVTNVKNTTIRHFVSIMTWRNEISAKFMTEFGNVSVN